MIANKDFQFYASLLRGGHGPLKSLIARQKARSKLVWKRPPTAWRWAILTAFLLIGSVRTEY